MANHISACGTRGVTCLARFWKEAERERDRAYAPLFALMGEDGRRLRRRPSRLESRLSNNRERGRMGKVKWKFATVLMLLTGEV